MNDKLNKYLEEGETLLWAGKPEAFEVMDETNKKSITIKTLAGSLTCLIVAAVYLILAARAGAALKPAVFLVCAALAVYFAIAPYLDAGKLKDKTIYAVTDRRIITLMNDELKSAKYPDIEAAAFKTDKDGHSTVLFGPGGVKEPMRKWRGQSLYGVRKEVGGSKCDMCVFYAVPDGEKLKEILSRYIDIS